MAEFLLPTKDGLERAAAMLHAGEVVAFPTETVYGLGADATNHSAVQRIFDAKGRPGNNPLIVHVLDAKSARRWAREWPADAQRLAERFWPGPLTMILPAADGLSSQALAGGTTVGLRAPDHPVALKLLETCGLPLAAPSANRSGNLSPVDAQHVMDDLGSRIAGVLDGGPCHVGLESTVLDLTGKTPVILRPGMITQTMIEETIGHPVRLAEHMVEQGSSASLKSPGLLSRHYAPRVPLRIKSREEISSAPQGIARLLVEARDLNTQTTDNPDVYHLGNTAEEFASQLYRVLWVCQSSGVAEIWVEIPPDAHEWTAVRNRLRRACVPEDKDTLSP